MVKKVGGMLPQALGPWMYALLDGQTDMALESIEIEDMCSDGGEELVCREFDQRFPDKVAGRNIRNRFFPWGVFFLSRVKKYRKVVAQSL